MSINAVKQYRGLADAILRAAIDDVVNDLSRDPLRGQGVVIRGLRQYDGTLGHPSGSRSFTVNYQYRIGDRTVTINSIEVTGP